MAKKPKKPKAIIVDMDGTLTNVSAIRHHVAMGNRDFHAFHTQSVDQPPNDDVVDQVKAFHESGHHVVVVTARKEQYRPHTAFWLADHGVPSDTMIMRGDQDQRPDDEVKRGILKQVQSRFEVVHAIDDNPSVIKVWKDAGIPVTEVPGFHD